MLAAVLSAPDTDPDGRDAASITDPGQYAVGAPVWIYRSGAWRPGLVECRSTLAATVRYRHAQHRGTVVDTAVAAQLAPRAEHDQDLDPAPATTGDQA
ncbi:hypothetical protein [Actinoplanes sp. NPDC051851]|uniref:hypothetical protein n=1 Tax=Actinoplanes sp. NPDC051851 TaxID=3154753 RepID=UPI003442A3D4